MNSSDVCLAADQLRAFRCGALTSEADVERIAEHLVNCPRCQECFESFEDSPLGTLLELSNTASILTSLSRSATRLVHVDWNDVPPPDALAQHPKWQCLSVLGKGGMGIVYLARHRHLQEPDGSDRLRALKILQVSLVAGREYAERFYREVRIITQLPDHRQIVRAYDVEPIESFFVLEMEYVSGRNLEEVARSYRSPAGRAGKVPVNLACSYVVQALAGVAFAEQHGIVHRDLKPENLMLTPDGTIKILDFGLAKIRSSQDTTSQHTRAGIQGCGSPKYLSPEQAADFATADARSDQYALGCTLYRLIAGQPPFGEHTGHHSDAEIFQAHKHQRPAPLRAICPEVPPQLSEAVERMLAKSPGDRFASHPATARALLPFVPPKTRELVKDWLQRFPTEKVERPRALIKSRYGLVAVVLLAAVLLPWITNLQTSFHVQTKAGVVEFEVDDPSSVDIRIDNQAVDKTRIRVRAKGERTWLSIEADAGQRELRITKPGFEVFSENVRVLAGTAVPVRVRLIPAPKTAKPNTAEPKISGTKPTPQVAGQKLLDAEYMKHWNLLGSNVTEVSFADGILTASNPTQTEYEDHLVTRASDYQNFRLRYEVRIGTPRCTSTVMLRVDPSPFTFGGMRGYQVVLRPQQGAVSGAVQLEIASRARASLPLASVDKADITYDRWIPVEVVVKGSQVRIIVDGQPILNHIDEGLTFMRGAIALRFLSGAKVQYRGLSVEELKSPPPPSTTRTRWVHRKDADNEWNEIWGVFAQSGDRKWTETTTSINQYYRFEFSETHRTDDYIELTRKMKEHEFVMRLYADHIDSGFNRDQLHLDYRGGWEASNSNSPHSPIPGAPTDAPPELPPGQSVLRGHLRLVWDLAAGPDENKLVSAGADGTVRIWNTKTNQEIRLLSRQTNRCRCAAWSPNGKYIAAGCGPVVMVWNAETGEEIYKLKGHTGEVRGIGFHPDSTYLVTGSLDTTVKTWNLSTGAVERTYYGHTGFIEGSVFSPNGEQLASGSWDRTVRVWNFKTGQELKSFTGHTLDILDVRYHPSGKLLASTAADSTVRVWDLEKWELKHVLNVPNNARRVWSAVFSQDGRYLINCCDSPNLTVWDTETGERMTDIPGNPAGSLCLTFNSSFNQLICGAGRVTVLDLPHFLQPDGRAQPAKQQ